MSKTETKSGQNKSPKDGKTITNQEHSMDKKADIYNPDTSGEVALSTGGDKGVKMEARSAPSPDLNSPLPCPHCGSTAIKCLEGYKFYRYYCSECEKDRVRCPDRDKALRSWNRRVS